MGLFDEDSDFIGVLEIVGKGAGLILISIFLFYLAAKASKGF